MKSDQDPTSDSNSSDLDQDHLQQPRWPWTTKENRDFKFDRGACVFTREALISRGHCCHSGCRHCPYRDPKKSKRRVHSLVPSWTETLLLAQAQVVGRTRYCIHPRDLVSSIPSHGGTKTLQAEHPSASLVRPGDLVILDRDENPKAFLESFQARGAEVLATHVRNLEDLHRELGKLAENFLHAQDHEVAQALNGLRVRTRQVMQLKPSHRLPILRSLGGKWSQDSESSATALVIWQQGKLPKAKGASDLDDSLQSEKPHSPSNSPPNLWMLASSEVFLGDLFWRLTGQKLWSPPEADRRKPNDNSKLTSSADTNSQVAYPQVSGFPRGTQILLMTEPYPFWRNFESWAQLLLDQGARGVHLVDGEAMSWFGIRSLRALEDLLEV